MTVIDREQLNVLLLTLSYGVTLANAIEAGPASIFAQLAAKAITGKDTALQAKLTTVNGVEWWIFPLPIGGLTFAISKYPVHGSDVRIFKSKAGKLERGIASKIPIVGDALRAVADVGRMIKIDDLLQQQLSVKKGDELYNWLESLIPRQRMKKGEIVVDELPGEEVSATPTAEATESEIESVIEGDQLHNPPKDETFGFFGREGHRAKVSPEVRLQGTIHGNEPTVELRFYAVNN